MQGAQAIEVKQKFTWTGGTLNSTDLWSSLTLSSGATATISPAAGKTLTTGGNIFLANAAAPGGGVVNVTAGTIQFENTAGFHVGAHREAKLDVNLGDITFVGDPGMGMGMSSVTIGNGGKVSMYVSAPGIVPKQTCRLTDMPITLLGGDLILADDVTADVSGQTGLNADDPSVHLEQGRIILADYTKLKVADGLKADGGAILTTPSTRVFYDTQFTSLPATIEGNFKNYGAQVVMYHNSSDRNLTDANGGSTIGFSHLIIVGDVYWENGTFRPAVYGPGANVNHADRLSITGEFTSACSMPITPTPHRCERRPDRNAAACESTLDRDQVNSCTRSADHAIRHRRAAVG